MKKWQRREFIKKTVAGLVAFPHIIKASAIGLNNSTLPSNTITIGCIGVGGMGTSNLKGFLAKKEVKVLAVCDVDQKHAEQAKALVDQAYGNSDCQIYHDFRELLARPDIDAIMTATPDHWHALIAIDALKAGKDVYIEKPLTFTIQEGKILRQTVRKYNRILGVGSQQRSDPNFQHAVKLVQDGKLGEIEKVFSYVGGPPKPYDLPREILPKDLNWDLWLGPNPYVHYNPELNPPISINPEKNEKIWGGWRWYKEMGGGFTTDWGAHMFDIAQWGLGMDKSGPVEIIPAGYKDYQFLTYKYESGVIMTEEPFNKGKTKGVKFQGKDGWIEVSRGHFKASNPSFKPKLKTESGPYETKIPHQINFIEAVRNRKDPVVPVEIGHRSCTVCTLGNISYDLKRPIKWNPNTEEFVDDLQADLYMHREYRKGYKLPAL